MIQEDFKLGTNSYWILQPDGIYEGPYCMVCWEIDDKKVHLHLKEPRGREPYYECPSPESHGMWPKDKVLPPRRV
jgi:hypothetical protein